MNQVLARERRQTCEFMLSCVAPSTYSWSGGNCALAENCEKSRKIPCWTMLILWRVSRWTRRLFHLFCLSFMALGWDASWHFAGKKRQRPLTGRKKSEMNFSIFCCVLHDNEEIVAEFHSSWHPWESSELPQISWKLHSSEPVKRRANFPPRRTSFLKVIAFLSSTVFLEIFYSGTLELCLDFNERETHSECQERYKRTKQIFLHDDLWDLMLKMV